MTRNSIGMTSRKLTPIVTAMPTPTQAAVIAPRSTKRLMRGPDVPGRQPCRRASGHELPAAGRTGEGRRDPR